MRILLVDDHTLFREGLVHVLKRFKRGAQVLQAGRFDEALRLAAEAGPDLVLLDAMLPDQQGLQGLKLLRRRFPTLPVLMISAYEESALQRRALSLGAAGFLPKSASTEQMLAALRAATGAGQRRKPMEALPLRHGLLTPRQMDVLGLLSQGRSNKDIAKALGLAPNTVRTHLLALYKTLGVSTRTQAALKAVKQGLVHEA